MKVQIKILKNLLLVPAHYLELKYPKKGRDVAPPPCIWRNYFQAFPLLLADIAPSGDMNAQIIHGPSDRTRLKFMSQIGK